MTQIFTDGTDLRNSDKINHQFVSSSLSFRQPALNLLKGSFARRNLLNSFIKA